MNLSSSAKMKVQREKRKRVFSEFSTLEYAALNINCSVRPPPAAGRPARPPLPRSHAGGELPPLECPGGIVEDARRPRQAVMLAQGRSGVFGAKQAAALQ